MWCVASILHARMRARALRAHGPGGVQRPSTMLATLRGPAGSPAVGGRAPEIIEV